jgi:hypothetical protein
MKNKYTRIMPTIAMAIASSAWAEQVDVINNASYSVTNATLGVKVLAQDNVTWTKDKTYILTDRLFIKDGQTLTIEPGTKIYGSFNDNGTSGTKSDDKVGSLIASRGGRLVADGTAAEPIVFTSIRELEALTGVDSEFDPDSTVGPAPGPADAGHWGGVILLGNAYISSVNSSGVNAGNLQIEGFLPNGTPSNDGDALSDASEYGFDANYPRDDADDSGVVRYVSIRHGGYEFESGKEINGLTLGGVGSGTTIEYVEVFANQDDGIEFFGGTVSTSHLVMAFNQDDSFDIDQAWTSDNQFWLAVQNPGIADAGGEWDGIDGSSSGFATGAATVRNLASPRIYNASFFGPGSDRTLSKLPATTGQVAWEKGNYAMHIEDYFNGQIYNSAFHDFAQGFVKFNDNATSTGQQAAAANNTIGDYGGTAVTNTNSLQLFYNTDGVTTNNGNEEANDFGADEITAYERDANSRLKWINPLPKAGSTLLTSSVTSGAPVATNYRGAFGTVNWAKGWTKLDQAGYFAEQVDVINNASYSVTNATLGVKVLAQDNVTWTKDKTYILTDRLFIKDGQTLTIEPGTKIYGSFNDNGTSGTKSDDKVGSLIASRGGRLVADGTAAEPIVFTSIRELEALTGVDSEFDPDSTVGPAPGPADAGHWGGVILLGNAYISSVNSSGVNAGNLQIEGFLPNGTPSNDGDALSDASEYGFDANYPRDDADDSGVVRYVSIRHGGYEFESGKEINGLTLGGVGSGTTIEYVEVFANQDDGIEFFGGTVSTSHLVMAFNQDDSFDIDQAWTSDNQFWLAVQNPGIADAGGEWDGIDGSSSGFATGAATVRNLASPRIYNASFFGPGSDRTLSKLPATTGQVAWEKGNYAMHIEDYFNGQIYNSAFHDFAQGFVKFNDNATSTGQQAAAKNNTIGDYGGTAVTNTNSLQLFYNTDGTTTNNGNEEANDFGADEITAYERDANSKLKWINPLPKADSTLLTSSITPGAPETAVFRGAFGSTNWAGGWTKLSQAGYLNATYSVTPASSLAGDADGDGISDSVEAANTALGFNAAVNDATAVLGTLKTTAQFNANYTAGQTSVTSNPNSFSLYNTADILDLRTVGQTTVQAGASNVTLTVPVQKSTGLSTWESAGSMTLTIPKTADKEFYRLSVEGAE